MITGDADVAILLIPFYNSNYELFLEINKIVSQNILLNTSISIQEWNGCYQRKELERFILKTKYAHNLHIQLAFMIANQVIQ